MTYYKVLAVDGVSPQHGGSGKWFVPKDGRVGEWMPAIKDISPCSRGYHFVTLEQLPRWIGPTLYEVEVRGQIIHESDKSVAEQARLVRRIETWNDKTLRLYAADCAERVVSLYEKDYPTDTRPRKAIQAARDFANGKITAEELNAAANAAYDAAYAAYATAFALDSRRRRCCRSPAPPRRLVHDGDGGGHRLVRAESAVGSERGDEGRVRAQRRGGRGGRRQRRRLGRLGGQGRARLSSSVLASAPPQLRVANTPRVAQQLEQSRRVGGIDERRRARGLESSGSRRGSRGCWGL